MGKHFQEVTKSQLRLDLIGEQLLTVTDRGVYRSKISLSGLSWPWTGPSHYLNKCWLMKWTLWNKLQQKLNQNTVQENAFQNVVCKIAAILFGPQCEQAHWPITSPQTSEGMLMMFTHRPRHQHKHKQSATPHLTLQILGKSKSHV